MKIQDRALLVKLRIESWGTSRKDKDANRAVAAAKESLESATTVSKKLVPPDSLKAVKSAADEAREYVRTLTQPWAEDGGRLLDAGQIFHLQDQLRRTYRPAWDKEVRAFVDRLPYFRDQWGPESLGKLYNASLYPTREKMESEFVWELQTLPLNPDSKELRTILGTEYVEQIQEEAEARIVAQLCERICAPIENMVKRLTDRDATFKNSLVENVKDIANLIPALNLTNDPGMAALRQRILNELTRHSADDLRTSPTARQDTARKAKAILDNLSGYLPAEAGTTDHGTTDHETIVPFPDQTAAEAPMALLL